MNAEKFLSQIHKIDRDLEALLNEGETLKKLAERCAELEAKKAARKLTAHLRKINDKVNDYMKARQNVQTVIEVVNDDDCRLLLTKRYLNCEGWEYIAEEMHFSRAHIFRMRKKALGLVEGVLKQLR